MRERLIRYSPQTELTRKEREEILKEAHGSIMNQHFGENRTIYKARQLGEWKNMQDNVIKYVKKCPIC